MALALKRKAWDHSLPEDDVLAKIQIEVKRRDLWTLSEKLNGYEKLNDTVIEAYLNLITERAQNNSDVCRIVLPKVSKQILKLIKSKEVKTE